MAMARRGHRMKYTGIRSRGVRVATAALALTGTGLLVGGVASAATTPTLVQSKVIGGPLGVVVALDPTATDATATDTATASDGATAASMATATATASATGTAASSVVGSSSTSTATSTAAASATPSASSSGRGSSAVGSGSSGGGASAPQPRQTLAETGTDQSAPLLFAGGLTLLAGGLVFRFGPRTGTPRHAA